MTCEANTLSVPAEVWVPSIPPSHLCFGETSQPRPNLPIQQLPHFRHVIYATSTSQLLQVQRVSCIFRPVIRDIFRAELEDFQVHFDTGHSVALLEDRSTVEMLVDGARGERIVAIDVIHYSASLNAEDEPSTPKGLALQVTRFQKAHDSS